MPALYAQPDFPGLDTEQLATATAFNWPLLAPRWLPADCQGKFLDYPGGGAALQYQCGDDSLPYSVDISVQPGFLSVQFDPELRLKKHQTLNPWLGPLSWYQLRSTLQPDQCYYGLDPVLPPRPTRVKLPGFDASPLYYSMLVSAPEQLPPAAVIDRILASLDWLNPPAEKGDAR
ncbi:MAG: hypothetical protein IGS03_15975 [Candidatus Sericytochromatia bacterium]|nr:hypothetical protein [Candidatus Sericytochromatia bacterium]